MCVPLKQTLLEMAVKNEGVAWATKTTSLQQVSVEGGWLWLWTCPPPPRCVGGCLRLRAMGASGRNRARVQSGPTPTRRSHGPCLLLLIICMVMEAPLTHSHGPCFRSCVCLWRRKAQATQAVHLLVWFQGSARPVLLGPSCWIVFTEAPPPPKPCNQAQFILLHPDCCCCCCCGTEGCHSLLLLLLLLLLPQDAPGHLHDLVISKANRLVQSMVVAMGPRNVCVRGRGRGIFSCMMTEGASVRSQGGICQEPGGH